MTVGLREANQNFGRLVRAVRAGQTVILTDRGKPLARLVPVAPAGAPAQNQEAAWAELEAQGLLVRGKRRSLRTTNWRLLPSRGKTLTESVLDDRAERG